MVVFIRNTGYIIFAIIDSGQLYSSSPKSAINTSLLVRTPQKYPEVYRRDKVDKYAQYRKGNRILPIPELVEAVQ